jgi:hypothetical protein
MSRPLVALVGAGVLLAVAAAQDKKKPPRIAVNDPAELTADADFAVQGEYLGELEGKGAHGVQVIARGDGKFDVKAFRGGLPGAGGTPIKDNGTAVRDGSKVTVLDPNGQEFARISDGAFTLTALATGTLKKTARTSPSLGAKPPAGAVVLFGDPADTDKWDRAKLAELSDGKFLTVAGTGGIRSKQAFQAFKLHAEFRLPWMPNSRGQGRANSGVYLQDRYEVQVLDSFGLAGENNECGGIYQQFKPLVNMCLPPMVWQTYDIEFRPAQFDAAGKKAAPAKATIAHNGVTIHDGIEFRGPTGGGKPETPDAGPIQLQDHGDPLVYRNIWVQELK